MNRCAYQRNRNSSFYSTARNLGRIILIKQRVENGAPAIAVENSRNGSLARTSSNSL